MRTPFLSAFVGSLALVASFSVASLNPRLKAEDLTLVDEQIAPEFTEPYPYGDDPGLVHYANGELPTPQVDLRNHEIPQ